MNREIQLHKLCDIRKRVPRESFLVLLGTLGLRASAVQSICMFAVD